MSGPSNGHYSLARYRSEAAKVGDKKGAYVLDVDTDKQITIPRPTGDQMFDAEEAMRNGSSRDVLEALCGREAAHEVLDVVGSEDAAVLRAVTNDIADHFGLGG